MPRAAADDVAVVVLAGGEATRFPGKLSSDASGIPLLLRVYRNVRGIGPVFVSANEPLGESLTREMQCTVVADRQRCLGPLGGLVSTFEMVPQARCFVTAGDAPLVDRDVFERLESAWDDRLDAVVAESSHGLEPLCAIYRRQAFLREAAIELRTGSGSVRAVAEKLGHARVRMGDDRLASINFPADRGTLLGIHS